MRFPDTRNSQLPTAPEANSQKDQLATPSPTGCESIPHRSYEAMSISTGFTTEIADLATSLRKPELTMHKHGLLRTWRSSASAAGCESTARPIADMRVFVGLVALTGASWSRFTLSIETSKPSRFAPTRERRRDVVNNGSRHRERR